MSKQEILSWTSIATTLSVLFFYLLFTIGWPAFLPDFSGNMAKIFFNLFIIAVVVEIIVNSVTSKKSVDKDERDFMIEAHGFRYAYNFLVTVFLIFIGHLFITPFFIETADQYAFLSISTSTIHVLFISLLLSNAIKRGVMVYHYKRAW